MLISRLLSLLIVLGAMVGESQDHVLHVVLYNRYIL